MTDVRIVIYEGNYWGKVSRCGNSIKNSLENSLNTIEPGLTEDVKFKICENVRNYLKENQFLQKDGEDGLRFVGVFQIRYRDYGLRFYVLPKYLEVVDDARENPERYMLNIRKVIEKTSHLCSYTEDKMEFNAYQRNKQIRRVSRHDLAKWLVTDYEQNGVFAVREKKNCRDRRGRIAWNRTILKTVPVIENETVAYVAPINTFVTRNDRILLSDIHRCAIREALDELRLSGLALSTVDPIYDERLPGHLKEYASIVKNYQRWVFTERDIVLLRYLEAWCLYESNYYMQPYGTFSFELVWEDVLRGVFGHKALNGKVGFGAPVYHIGGKRFELDGDSIPDVLNFWNDDSGKVRFVVIDGKYYLGQCFGQKVSGLPGYKDVAKQIDYFETLINIYKLEDWYGRNVFILPQWDPLCDNEMETELMKIPVRYVGYVRKPDADESLMKIIGVFGNNSDKDDKNGSRVHLIQIDPDRLYQVFLRGVENTAEYAEKLCDYIEEKYAASI